MRKKSLLTIKLVDNIILERILSLYYGLKPIFEAKEEFNILFDLNI